MGFLFGLVVGQNRPLAEYSTIEGNHIQTAMKVIKSMNRNNRSAFSDHGDYVFTLKSNEDGFILISAYSQSGNATRHINLYKKINNEFINIYYFVCDSGLVYIQSPLFFVKKDEIIKCQGGTSSQNFKFYPLKQL